MGTFPSERLKMQILHEAMEYMIVWYCEIGVIIVHERLISKSISLEVNE